MKLLASEVSADYDSCPPGSVSLPMLTMTYIEAIALHIHTQDRFNNHTVCSLYMVMITATSVMGEMKMGLCLEQESNSHLWHSGPVYYRYTM